MRFDHELGKSIKLFDDNGVERLCYHYQLGGDAAPSAPRPFCHPVRTARGTVLTEAPPVDHCWHRGIWFAWKFLNGVNYWEENVPVYGRQTTQAPPHVEQRDAQTVRWTSDIAWHDAQNGADQTRLVEQRTITASLSSNDILQLTWQTRQTAQEDLLLDRTPFTTWGGYSGLVVRLSDAVDNDATQIVFDHQTQTKRPVGETHEWGAIETHLPTTGETAAVVFFPSPQNARFPHPFYGSAKPNFNFFGPAPLFHEPWHLGKGETIALAYRVLILPTTANHNVIDAHWTHWRNDSKKF